MKVIEKIKKPIYNEMQTFEKKFAFSMSSKVVLLNRITHFIVKRKGKQMRPMLVFLIANLLGKTNERTYRAASVIELIHTATLIHDDIVDDSFQRRNFFSINAIWKNKIAVLVGDYLLSKGLLLNIENEDFDLLKTISKAVKKMSQGELLQIEKTRALDITESIYYKIIQQKTAILIATCCVMGAQSIYTSKKIIAKIYEFGMLIGTAFQIKDDLFDYSKKRIGKPTGIDIKEKKITLPLIYCIDNAKYEEKKWILNTIKNHNKNKKRVNQLIEKVKEMGGLEYAIKKMKALKKQALDILITFPDNEYRKSLELMVNYVIDREQ